VSFNRYTTEENTNSILDGLHSIYSTCYIYQVPLASLGSESLSRTCSDNVEFSDGIDRQKGEKVINSNSRAKLNDKPDLKTPKAAVDEPLNCPEKINF
jgi:hypothetical protein